MLTRTLSGLFVKLFFIDGRWPRFLFRSIRSNPMCCAVKVVRHRIEDGVLCSSTWEELLHESRKTAREKTKAVVEELRFMKLKETAGEAHETFPISAPIMLMIG